jgi:hypothetical protein
MLDAFVAGDGSIEFPGERATCRNEQATGHVFRRFYAEPEGEILPTPTSLILETRPVDWCYVPYVVSTEDR